MKTNLVRLITNKIAIAMCCVMMLLAGAAFAQTANPNNITGTWRWKGNTTGHVLRIFQGANGVITGTLQATVNGPLEPIEGIYIPSVRRLVFVRKYNGAPFQFYQAHVSVNGLRMAGGLHAWNGAGGGGPAGVDFNFCADKYSDNPYAPVY
ncbi:MAG TPA: hypothetical protein VNO70_10990 [Blastocatellia bacterium]|nr:hypothetical protein [Blastocatellia bacterium]